MAVQISQITEPDIPGAVACIQRAFEQDPYNNWVFDKANFSTARNRDSLTLRCQWGIQHALFHVAKDPNSPNPSEILGVACWLPPHPAATPQTWWDWYGEWKLWLQQGIMNIRHMGRGGLNVSRYWNWKAAQATAQKEIWTDTQGYYFCNVVTVAPEAQGKGVGKLLFKEVTDLADREGRKCYLESSRAEPNMAIYERMGFSLAKELRCEDPKDGEGITLYCMTREPQSSKT